MHDQLLKYLAGDLTAAERETVAEKIASDPQWQTEWQRLQKVDSELRAFAHEVKKAPERYWDSFQIRLDARREARPSKSGLRLTLTYALPAMAAAALVLIFLNVYRPNPESDSIAAVSSAELDTALQALKPDWYEDFLTSGETSESADYQLSDDDVKSLRERLNVDFKSVTGEDNGYFQTLSHDDQKELLQQLENTTIM